MSVIVTSTGVEPSDVVAVARSGTRVVLDETALAAMRTSRSIVDGIERDGRPG